MEKTARYRWPASRLTPADMHCLHLVREAAPRRTSISQLVAEAVRLTYGAGRPPMPAPSPDVERGARE